MVRRYRITVNNYKKIDISKFKKLNYTYLIIGDEIAPTTGTPHLQVFVILKNDWKDGYVKWIKAVGTKRWSVLDCNASNESNSKYCRKEKVLFEKGEFSAQGSRSDIRLVREMCQQNKSIREISKVCSGYQAIRYAETYYKYNEPKRKIGPVEIIWIWGASGVGKSSYCWERENLDDIVTPTTEKWWDDYDQHPVVLIDDIDSEWCGFKRFLRITDIYPYRVETKGGTRQIAAKRFYITSSVKPQHIWENEEDQKQLLRRLTKVIHMEQKSSVIPENLTKCYLE